jgi:mRNA interferase HigB
VKVRLIKKKSVVDFLESHPNGRAAFMYWLYAIKAADWIVPADILDTFASAHLLGKGSDRVVFDIGGNKHRVICQYFFGTARVHLYIKWIGHHKDYTMVCKANKQFTIRNF